MALELPLTLEPMEAEPVDELPDGEGWQFEPKYDGFRCLVFRDGDEVHLQSRRQKPLNRYFPEVVAAVATWPGPRFVLDGELLIPDRAFDALQLRLHPAASRVAKLAVETPARFVAFDLLAGADGASTLAAPLEERRAALERWGERVELSEVTRSAATARGWLTRLGHGLDGIVAKRLDQPYRPGERGVLKYKVWRSVDCVVGGFYERAADGSVEYLLLGLYDSDGRLNYVGRCPVGPRDHDVSARLRSRLGGDGFAVNAPGGKSRWSARERAPVSVTPDVVVEVSADHVEAGQFRHGSRLLRWRDDKRPEACTMDQLGG